MSYPPFEELTLKQRRELGPEHLCNVYGAARCKEVFPDYVPLTPYQRKFRVFRGIARICRDRGLNFRREMEWTPASAATALPDSRTGR